MGQLAAGCSGPQTARHRDHGHLGHRPQGQPGPRADGPCHPAIRGRQLGYRTRRPLGQVRRGDAVEPIASNRGRWDLFYTAFAAAVRGKGPVPVDPWDAVATATVLDAARSSARDGRVVRLP
ncbi:Gfo/Idh/MocA family oxidoreductase [Streptomyces mirabilis]|uniref:Gfo/Idh/MocA family oxidoreductase n=1 Tax=Streptomyces TaxID=1883 RepID=UPI0031FD1F6F